MSEDESRTISSRAAIREGMARQVETFLQRGGQIEPSPPHKRVEDSGVMGSLKAWRPDRFR